MKIVETKYTEGGQLSSSIKQHAERINGQAVNGARKQLKDVIPLHTPYVATVFPVYACNFRCSYCVHSKKKKERSFVAKNEFLPFDIYRKFADGLKEFPEQVRALHFTGLGEPTLHPNLARMVRYAKEIDATQTVDTITNGYLLNKVGDDLLDAGIDCIRISLQGLSSEEYFRMSGVHIDFDAFCDTIARLYKRRGHTRIYIKIMDVSLKDRSEDEFYSRFENISDQIAIEHLCPLAESINYNDTFDMAEFVYTMNGNRVPNAQVCPQPFYTMQVNPDGDIIPCCTIERPVAVGNVVDKSPVEIWNSKAFHDFRRLQIQKRKNENPVCRTCMQYKFGMFPEDYLDDEAETILKRMDRDEQQRNAR